MQCPACLAPLIVIEHEAIEIDYCSACKGIWLDAGELELLFGGEPACRAFLAGGEAAPSGEKPRKCPICSKPMAKQRTSGVESVVYDRCHYLHGLWLDDGELAQIVRLVPALPGGAMVHDFLRDLFEHAGEGE